jgi:hypothetical protein
MQDREHNAGHLSRSIGRAGVLLLLLGPLLSGCLPGMDWGDGEEDNTPAAHAQGAPALNRDYKTNFLTLRMPSLGMQNVQAHLMPDIGPAILGAFSTVESRRPAPVGAPSRFAALTNPAAGYEPVILPPARSLAKFYAALSALASGRRTQPVSILHLGDDHLAYDRFSGPLREHLVSRFGSAGRGLMMPGLFPIRGMKVSRGGQWHLESSAAGAKGPFGITGVRMTSGASQAWIRFTVTPGAFDWAEVTFLAGPDFGTALVSIDGDTKLVPTRGRQYKETAIRVNAKAREILVKPRGDGPIAVLSAATGIDKRGILYSSLGLPGATASTPAKWSPDFLANDFEKLHPDLILIEYGTREGFDDGLDVKQYEMRLAAIIALIREKAPQASILVVGPPDAARLPGFAGSMGAQACRALNRYEIAYYRRMIEAGDERLARWHAPPKLDAVRAAQRRAAAAVGAYFWDWTRYMGGACSIHAWATSTPPLAERDHITLTKAGDKRSARALFAELMAGYNTYQRDLRAKAQTIAAAAKPARAHHHRERKKRKIR